MSTMPCSVSARSRLAARLSSEGACAFSGACAVVLNLFVFCSCMERAYAPGQSSGSLNAYVYVAYVLVGIVLLVSMRGVVRYRLTDLVMCASVAYFLFWAFDYRALLYAFIALALFVLSKVSIGDLRLAHRLLVVAGLACSLAFCMGEDRWCGFLNTSAPIFGLIMLVSMTYLLFCRHANRFDFALAILAFALTIMTQTRVVQLVGAVILLARLGGEATAKAGSFFRAHRVVAVVLLVLLVSFVLMNYEDLLSLVSREGGDDSNRTRVGLMAGTLSQWLGGPSSLILGNGGGYAMAYTAKANAAFVGNLPVHQDCLMLLCDYGILGFGMLAVGLFPALRRWPWYCVLITAMATFHNVYTSGAGLMVMFLSFQSLAWQRMDSDAQ